jgi:XTP/dITP diphosphohydrolase
MSKNANNDFKYEGRVVFFATGNLHKFHEVRTILADYDIAVGMLKVKGDEIQSENLEEIAQKSVQNAYSCSRLPIFVEDAGLFIDALNGFPGPYAAYVYKTISNKGILKLMEDQNNRKAQFQSVIAYSDEKNQNSPIFFYGESKGIVTMRESSEQNKSSFGFDPIFQPQDSKKTFAEMTLGEKNVCSHRALAVRKFAEWYKTQ